MKKEELTKELILSVTPYGMNELIDSFIMNLNNENLEDYPNWSGDVAAAWKVLEKIQSLKELKGKQVRLQVRIITLKSRTMVTIQNYLEHFETISETINDSFPMAMCEAALLAVME